MIEVGLTNGARLRFPDACDWDWDYDNDHLIIMRLSTEVMAHIPVAGVLYVCDRGYKFKYKGVNTNEH